MNLETALAEFRKNQQLFSALALAIIRESLAGAVKLNFELSDDFVSDTDDLFHIHSTMIVAQQPFPGSVDRGPEPYKKWPHFRQLPNFSAAAAKSAVPVIKTSKCPATGYLQPSHVICPTCDVLH